MKPNPNQIDEADGKSLRDKVEGSIMMYEVKIDHATACCRLSVSR
jgi:hypothetical protein